MADSMKDIVCIHHTDTQAVARCFVCRKPLCAKCVKQKAGMVFCSESCMASGLKSVGDVNRIMKSKKRCDFTGFIRNLILLGILVLAGLGVYKYRKPLKSQWDEWFGKGKNAIQDVIDEGNKGFDNKIERVQRKQHGKKYDAINETN